MSPPSLFNGRVGLLTYLLHCVALVVCITVGASAACHDGSSVDVCESPLLGSDPMMNVSMVQRKLAIESPQLANGRRDVANGQSGRSKPNILIVHPDDMYHSLLDWEGMGVFNTRGDPPDGLDLPITPADMTPQIQQLTSEGTVFYRAYTVSPVCSPSRLALLTGRYPSRSDWNRNFNTYHGNTGTDGWLYGVDKQENIAAILQNSGYLTGHVGKWHLTDRVQGGSFFFNYSDQQQVVREAGFDYADGVYIMSLGSCTHCEFTHNMEWITEKALEFMDLALGRGLPFFLYYNPTVPHLPLAKRAFQVSLEAYQTPAGQLASLPNLTRFCEDCYMDDRTYIWGASEGLGNDQWRSMVSSLIWIDLSIGVLHSYLAEQGVWDKTYVILTSDHSYAKSTLYESGCRVPLIVKGQGVLSGQRRTELVSNIDIAPTLLEVAGVSGDQAWKEMDGISWASLVEGTETSWGHDEIFFEVAYDRAVLMGSDGDMKYINAGHGNYTNKRETLGWTGIEVPIYNVFPAWGMDVQLFNVTQDLFEQANLALTVGDQWEQTTKNGQSLINMHKEACLADVPLSAIFSPESSK